MKALLDSSNQHVTNELRHCPDVLALLRYCPHFRDLAGEAQNSRHLPEVPQLPSGFARMSV